MKFIFKISHIPESDCKTICQALSERKQLLVPIALAKILRKKGLIEEITPIAHNNDTTYCYIGVPLDSEKGREILMFEKTLME